jgi:hypothetical protein
MRGITTAHGVNENRAGAASNLGTEMVVRASPDGYTLLFVGQPSAINATLYPKLNFHFVTDIAPVAGIARTPTVLVVNPSLPVRTVADLVAYAKAHPGKLNLHSSPEADYFRAGFLGYVAGTPEDRSLVPKLTLSSDIINMSQLVDLIAAHAQGRTSDKQTSFFLNVGAIGVQFEAVAATVFKKARERGLGKEIPTDWFLQDIRD